MANSKQAGVALIGAAAVAWMHVYSRSSQVQSFGTDPKWKSYPNSEEHTLIFRKAVIQ